MSSTIWDGEDDHGTAFTRGLNLRALSKSRSEAPSNAPQNLLSQLTDGQKDCLRLVFNHQTSKDIARALGVSHHTVDMRLRTAMKVLGVTGRTEAARLFAQEEMRLGISPEAYQPLIYQPSDMENPANPDTLASTASLASGAEFGFTNPAFARQPVSPDAGPDASGPPRNAYAPGTSEAEMLGSRSGAEARDFGPSVRPLADSLPWGKRNTLSVGVRLS